MPADIDRTGPADAGSEAGFTLAEVVIAIFILALSTLAVLQVFDASTRNAYRVEQTQAAINVAQREIEEIRSLDYDQIALSSTPTSSEDENDPRQRVDGTRFDASDDGALFEIVRNGGSLDDGGSIDCSTTSSPCIAAGPDEFTSGDINGEIFRFVVWRNDPTCSPAACAGSQDLKRVIVAVRLDNVAVAADRPYIEVQSDFVDPDATLMSDLPTGDEVNVPQQFWLTDTPCAQDDRQAITADDPAPEGHRLHNTLGTCDAGVQTESTAGAPDLLAIEPPPDPSANDPADPPVLDYATDLEPTSGPDDDEGLQMVRQSNDGCSYSGGAESPQQKVHRWVTPPVNAYPPTSFVATGSATLVLYLRSLGGAQHSGKICTYLFRRTAEVGGVATDEVFDSDTFSVGSWPGDWGAFRIPLTFASTTFDDTERLGVAISIERAGTPADTVQVLYDHPKFQSRLEVITSTPLSE